MIRKTEVDLYRPAETDREHTEKPAYTEIQ